MSQRVLVVPQYSFLISVKSNPFPTALHSYPGTSMVPETTHPFLPPVCTQCSTGPSSLPPCTETFKSQPRQSFHFLHVASQHFYSLPHRHPPGPCRVPSALCGHCSPSIFPCLYLKIVFKVRVLAISMVIQFSCVFPMYICY